MKRAKLLAVVLAFVTQQAAAEEVPADVHDGGVCIGLGWLTLAPGEQAVVSEGPDYAVFYFSKADDPSYDWGVYDGSAPQVSATGPTLLERDGIAVVKSAAGGKFRGYIAKGSSYSMNHFFGSVFDGTEKDKAVFDRVDFGETGKALCRKVKA